jgi:hypothetical protein
MVSSKLLINAQIAALVFPGQLSGLSRTKSRRNFRYSWVFDLTSKIFDQRGEVEYKAALRLSPHYEPAAINLADLYRQLCSSHSDVVDQMPSEPPAGSGRQDTGSSAKARSAPRSQARYWDGWPFRLVATGAENSQRWAFQAVATWLSANSLGDVTLATHQSLRLWSSAYD